MSIKRGFLFFVLIFAAFGCAAGSENSGLDAAAPPPMHPCSEINLDTDIWNCGACTTTEENYVCDVDKADSCVSGICQCGSGLPCDELFVNVISDCRFGQCVRQDITGAVCEYDHECTAGFVCVSGSCSFIACVPEECDSVDNDCDGLVDESDSGVPLTSWCVGEEVGDPSNAPLSPCQLGYRICFDGAWGECMEDVAPVPEQGLMGCDGVDNDCDGCPDGEFVNGICESSETSELDIVYIIDVSGSMSRKIEATKTATRNFSQSFPESQAYKFGIILLSEIGALDRPLLFQDLTDFSSFETALGNVPVSGGGSEPSYDAIYELGTGELPMSWRESSTRIIIVFTDETAQSFRARHGLSAVDEIEMCGALTHGETLVVVTLPNYYSFFDLCAQTVEISEDDKVMELNLSMGIQDPC